MGSSDQQHCFNVCADLIQYQSCYCYHGDHQPLRWLVCQHSDVVLAQTHRSVLELVICVTLCGCTSIPGLEPASDKC